MNTIQRVQELAALRGLSIYKLSQLSDVSYSTIRTAEKRNANCKCKLDTRTVEI